MAEDPEVDAGVDNSRPVGDDGTDNDPGSENEPVGATVEQPDAD